jgi:hypothetical protein
MITEKEYLQAVKIVQEYNEQIKIQSEKLFNPICFKTPNEIGKYELREFFTSRLANLLYDNFENVRLADIKKAEFLCTRNMGVTAWTEFNKVIKTKKQ